MLAGTGSDMIDTEKLERANFGHTGISHFGTELFKCTFILLYLKHLLELDLYIVLTKWHNFSKQRDTD